jgi:hypothetical protein
VAWHDTAAAATMMKRQRIRTSLTSLWRIATDVPTSTPAATGLLETAHQFSDVGRTPRARATDRPVLRNTK